MVKDTALRNRIYITNVGSVVVACNATGFTVRLQFVGTRPITPYCKHTGTVSKFIQSGRGLSFIESSLAPIDHHSYLEPTDPDDQEMDYDNIWEYDCDTGMIQPTSGISTHWTGLDFGARGLGAMATQQRWS